MVQVSDFNAVLQLGVVLNAILYFYDVIPYTEKALNELRRKYEEVKKEKTEVTKNHEVFPIGFLISCSYPAWKKRLSVLSIGFSLLNLFLLIYAGFCPKATLPVVTMSLILLFSGIVPVVGFLMKGYYANWIIAAQNDLQKQIDEARS